MEFLLVIGIFLVFTGLTILISEKFFGEDMED